MTQDRLLSKWSAVLAIGRSSRTKLPGQTMFIPLRFSLASLPEESYGQ
ncbi:hypothetical protein SAMN06295943_2767 [Agreia sp. VKM Ac-1783]|nr:hypothetical protein SAMN06295943_2767 [Agreia sp. VKM Ac-1783]